MKPSSTLCESTNPAMRTHIQTLADNTPKARRRVRRTLNLGSPVLVTPALTAQAQSTARNNERKGAEADKARRANR